VALDSRDSDVDLEHYEGRIGFAGVAVNAIGESGLVIDEVVDEVSA